MDDDDDDQRLFDERRKALENEFFQHENERLRQELREKEIRKEIGAELRAVTGIHDEEVLDQLAALRIGPDTLCALALVPLVEVAWADGKLDFSERQALLAAAKDQGIDQRHPGYGMLEGWLTRRPEPRMFEAWIGFVHGLRETMDADRYERLCSTLLERSRAMARAAGGFLGLRTVSPEEQTVLGVLERALDGS